MAELIFYDKIGNERGGLAITDNEETKLNILVFECQRAEALGILRHDNKQANYFRADLMNNDKDLSGHQVQNINHMSLIMEKGNSSLLIKVNNEVPRITLKVDSFGNPAIEIFDKNLKI